MALAVDCLSSVPCSVADVNPSRIPVLVAAFSNDLVEGDLVGMGESEAEEAAVLFGRADGDVSGFACDML